MNDTATRPNPTDDAIDTPATDTEHAATGAPALITRRKSCDTDGTGLSHYILMDRQVSQ